MKWHRDHGCRILAEIGKNVTIGMEPFQAEMPLSSFTFTLTGNLFVTRQAIGSSMKTNHQNLTNRLEAEVVSVPA
jgi:hypothetical protein